MTLKPFTHFLLIPALAALTLLACGGESEADDSTAMMHEHSAEHMGKQTQHDAASAADSTGHLFRVKSGTVDYNYTGSMEGNSTLFFDDYGETRVLMLDRMREGQPERKTLIWKDGKATMYDHMAKTISGSNMMFPEMEPSPLCGMTEHQLSHSGNKRLEDEKVAGEWCQVYRMKNSHVMYWLWNGIDLKEHTQPEDGGYVKEAMSVEEGTAIPEDVLAEPEGYTKR